MSNSGAKQAHLPTPGKQTKEVLHQQRKIPFSPAKLAVGGFVFIATIGYFTVYSKKKANATALEIAAVDAPNVRK